MGLEQTKPSLGQWPRWRAGRYCIDLNRPQVMAIVNTTPDSFSDGGQFEAAGAAIAHCERLIGEGADILDIGGESSRPGAPRLNWEDEWQRVEPVLRAAVAMGVPVSLDTCKTELMQRALDLGVDIINDIQALRAPGAVAALAAHPSAGICLMHMRGEPGTMQHLTDYVDLAAEVAGFLAERVAACEQHCIARERLMLDPGYGFAKTAQQNFELLQQQERLLVLGLPLLVGWSRKSALGAVTGRSVEQRLPGSLAAALLAVSRGARVLRVHDVAATVDVLKVWSAGAGEGGGIGENGGIEQSGGRSQ